MRCRCDRSRARKRRSVESGRDLGPLPAVRTFLHCCCFVLRRDLAARADPTRTRVRRVTLRVQGFTNTCSGSTVLRTNLDLTSLPPNEGKTHGHDHLQHSPHHRRQALCNRAEGGNHPSRRTPPQRSTAAKKAAATRRQTTAAKEAAEAKQETKSAVERAGDLAEKAVLVPVGAALIARDGSSTSCARRTRRARRPRTSCAASSAAARARSRASSATLKKTRTKVERELRQRRTKIEREVKSMIKDIENRTEPVTKNVELVGARVENASPAAATPPRRSPSASPRWRRTSPHRSQHSSPSRRRALSSRARRRRF